MTPDTLSSARKLLLARQISPSELLAQYIRQIEAAEPQVQAWRLLTLEQAKAKAKQLDQKLTSGQPLPPLFGIPYGAKDIFHTKGIPTEAGSKVIAGFVPDDNATVIDRLEAQDAILLGKTTTTEFANLGGPPTTGNPWHVGHTPGGSSSGSAAAMGARMALLALGTQTSGSMTRPASYNGLTLLKASFGRISKYGVIPCGDSLDHIGAFTHSVEDTVLVYNQLAGPDVKDAYTQWLPFEPLLARSKPGYSIGIIDDPYFQSAEPCMVDKMEAALEALASTGARIVRVALPPGLGFAELAQAQHVILQAECAHYHRAYYPMKADLYNPTLRDFLAGAQSVTLTDYLDAIKVRMAYRSAVARYFESIDLMVTPSAPSPAPAGRGATGSPAFNLPFTCLGIPTLGLPVGFSADGLPIGMQLAAPLREEQRLIDIGMHYQTLTDWHLQRPVIGSR